MTDTEPLDLDAIEARANAATDGPWLTVESRHRSRLFGVNAAEDYITLHDYSLTASDAEFIAHAREDVPALIAEVRRLREENGSGWERGILYGDNYEYFAGPGELRRLTEIGVQLREVRRRPAGPWEANA